MNTPHILVVDDDTRLRRLLKKYLKENGFEVAEAAQPAEASELMCLFVFDLIIMDVMMPRQNGQEFTKSLRAGGLQTPILMLTAMGDTHNRIAGLEAGADDYLGKPFEPKELLLRINSILKRSLSARAPEEVRFGSCRYLPQKGLLFKQGEPVALTSAEQELLRALVQQKEEVISREQLAEKLAMDNPRAVDVQITRLRRKIEEDIKKPLCIQTVRGKGYLLVLK